MGNLICLSKYSCLSPYDIEIVEPLNYSKYVILEFNIAGNESIEQQQHLELVVNYSSNLHQKLFILKSLMMYF